MKNLFLLPTDKPSRLACDFDKLILNSRLLSPILYKNQNIYITSDEEIKENEYYLDITANVIFKNDKLFLNGTGYKKVILTTDQDLIGVQAIDDEFLEWLVANPSCEWVKVNYDKDVFPYGVKTAKGYGWYKIIIPKEKSKQETLEEAAKKYAENEIKDRGNNNDKLICSIDFIAGAKWQQEKFKNESTADYIDRHIVESMVEVVKQKMYSEEEVHKIIESYQNIMENNPIHTHYDKWFEQFKKK